MGHRETKKLQEKTLRKLEKIKQILSTGAKTLRRIFYMVASGSYDSLGKLVVWARLRGEIDWDKIVEEGRYLEGSRTYNNPKEFLGEITELYIKNKSPSFKNYFEVWLEKATLQEIFHPITDKYDVGLLVTRGQISWTALKKASKRLNNNSVIIYFGDNDSYGKKMYKQIKEFLSMLGCNPQFIRQALTTEQERKFNFPRGEHHLDGLPEEELVKLLEATIKEYIHPEKFKALLKQEIKEKKKLKEMIKK